MEAPQDTPEIAKYLERGYFVVVDNWEYICPETEAHIKWVRTYLGHFPDRQSAESFAADNDEEDGLMTFIEVLAPRHPLPAKPAPANTPDGLAPLPKVGDYQQWFKIGRSDRQALKTPRSHVKPYMDGWNSQK